MARPKKQIKLKEPVRLREKPIKDGNKSLYLDIYYKGVRKYEYLKLYLIPEKSPDDKERNKNTMKLAEQLKAERILQIQGHGIDHWNVIKRGAMPLVKWMDNYAENPTIKLESSSQKIRRECKIVVEDYLYSIGRPAMSLEEVDRDFCRNYINYCRNLTNRRVKEEGKALSQNTRSRYQKGLSAALNFAVREGVISINPFTLIPTEEKISDKDGEREFLTIPELKTLINTPCPREDVKVAFLFSCYTGLRMSDIKVLNASHIYKSPDGTKEYIDMVMVKTEIQVVVPISEEAKKYLPEQPEYGKPFFTLPAKATIGRALDTWVKAAGIDKHITFHSARHTFATSLLTLGADIYVTSKLLGHRNIQTTEIYAKVIDSKKVESIKLLDNMFDNINAVK